MKKTIILLSLLLSVGKDEYFSQSLPAVAQALYNEMYNTNATKGQYAINNVAQFYATPGGNSFYLKWFPSASTPSTTALIVTLHGSGANVFDEFSAWHQQAQAHNCGIIALQWYRGASASPPNDYFNDTEIYTYIDSALTSISYPPGKALLHGFSRGSARSYAIVFKDSHGGKNYFCTTMSNSGGADSSYTLYNQINTGVYGNTVFAGKRWALFCGGQDPDPLKSGCIGMNNTKTWLQNYGATVDLFIQDQSAGHGGFHLNSNYVDSLLDYYLTCFNGTLPVKESSLNQQPLRIFPNPANHIFRIEFENPQHLKTEVCIFNSTGKMLNCYPTTNNYFVMFKDNLTPGLYYVEIKNRERNSQITKILIE